MAVQRIHIATLCILALLAPCLSPSLKAQTGKEEMKEEAEALFEEERFVEAMPLYSQLLAHEPKDPAFNYRYGVCALHGEADKEKPVKHLEYARKKKRIPPAAHYYLGRTYHLNYRFEDAIEAYQRFLDEGDPDEFPVERQIEMCENGRSLLKSPNELLVEKRTKTGTEEFFRYYDPQGVQGRILVAPDEIMQEGDRERDERSIIFFPTGSNTIHYASYGEDGENGKDLYQVKRKSSGEWGEPEKLNGEVNTPYDEDYPFKPPNSEYLYFCSKGHNSMGGYDIFRAEYDSVSESYQNPENLDFPINSPDDDLLYLADEEKDIAYFASGRSSDAEHLHVYEVSIQRIPMQTTVLKGRFKDRTDTSARMASILVRDAETNKRIGEFSSSSTTGDYLFSVPKSGSYQLTVSPEGSDEAYEGEVEVPQLDEVRPLKQRLFLEEKEGEKELVIENRFDERFENESGILAQVLKDKAELRSGGSEGVKEKLEDAKEGSRSEADEKRKKDELITEAKEEAEGYRSEADELAEKRDRAYSRAQREQRASREASRKADSLLREAERRDDPERRETLIEEAENAASKAEQKEREASQAYELGEELDTRRERKERAAERAREYQKALEETSESSADPEELRERTSAERAELKAVRDKDEEGTPSSSLRRQAEQSEEESQKALQRAREKEKEEKELASRVQNLERRIEASSGGEKEELQKEKRELEERRETLRKEAEETFSQADKKQSKADRVRERASLLEEIEEREEGSGSAEERNWTEERKEKLRNDLEESSKERKELSQDPLLAKRNGTDPEREGAEARERGAEGSEGPAERERIEGTREVQARSEWDREEREQELERDIEAIRSRANDPERQEERVERRKQRELERIERRIERKEQIRQESEDESERRAASRQLEELESLRQELREQEGTPDPEENRRGREERERARRILEEGRTARGGGGSTASSEREESELAREKAREARSDARAKRRKARRIRDSLERATPSGEASESERGRKERFRAMKLEEKADSSEGMARAFEALSEEDEQGGGELAAREDPPSEDGRNQRGSEEEEPDEGEETGTSEEEENAGGAGEEEEEGSRGPQGEESAEEGGSTSDRSGEGDERSGGIDEEESNEERDETSGEGSESGPPREERERGGAETDREELGEGEGAGADEGGNLEESDENEGVTLSRKVIYQADPVAIEASEGDLFTESEGSPYSEENPIPKDPEMPEGRIWQVQVGAFRNEIPQDHFQGFAPLVGKTGDEGITRYRAGFFKDRESAEEARDQIRAMGYSDAFVVVYEGGERTSLAQSPTTEGVDTEDVQGPERNEENSKSVEGVEGLFFTVQVGVYSDPVREGGALEGIEPLYVKRTANGYHRYSSGIFQSVERARGKVSEVQERGIEDAFITAYFEGERIQIDRAEELLAERGRGVLHEGAPEEMVENEGTEGMDAESIDPEEIEFQVDLGTYGDRVPNRVAEALLSSSDAEIRERRTEDGRTNYRTKSYPDLEEANESRRKFVNKGIEEAEIVALKENGERIPLEKAARILDER